MHLKLATYSNKNQFKAKILNQIEFFTESKTGFTMNAKPGSANKIEMTKLQATGITIRVACKFVILIWLTHGMLNAA